MPTQHTAFVPFRHMGKLLFIALAAGLGALASIVTSLQERAGFWGALLDAAMAFVLCAAAAAFTIHYTGWPQEVVGGLCGVVGLYSKKFGKQIESAIDTAGRAVRKKIEKLNK